MSEQMKRPPGRPKGSKNKVSKEAQKFFARLWRDPEFRKRFTKEWRDGKVAPPLMVAAAHYAFGKPVEQVSIDGDAERAPTAFVLVLNGKALVPGADRD